MNKFVKQYRCTLCNQIFSPQDIQYTCPKCGEKGILDVEYDYEAMKKVRECITEETPYKGRVIRQTPPSEHSGKRNTGGQGLSLLPKLCTHRLGYNSGRW